MKRLTAGILVFAKSIGGFGIFVIAFLDSSFLSFPVVTDATIISMVAAHRERVLFYAAMATLGSVAGCTALYLVAKKGEEAFLKERFQPKSIEWARGLMQKHGFLAVLVAGVLPPPAPFKLFVLLAGVVGISAGRFAAAITIGRSLRYFALGFLAVKYGARATTYMRAHGTTVSLIVVGVLAAAFALSLLWRKARARRS